MMSLTFGLFTQVSCSGPLGPLVLYNIHAKINLIRNVLFWENMKQYQVPCSEKKQFGKQHIVV